MGLLALGDDGVKECPPAEQIAASAKMSSPFPALRLPFGRNITTAIRYRALSEKKSKSALVIQVAALIMRRGQASSVRARGVLAVLGLFFMLGSLIWLHFFRSSNSRSQANLPSAKRACRDRSAHGGWTPRLAAGCGEGSHTASPTPAADYSPAGFRNFADRATATNTIACERADLPTATRLHFLSILSTKGAGGFDRCETYYATTQFERARPFCPGCRSGAIRRAISKVFSQSWPDLSGILVARTQAFNRGTRAGQFLSSPTCAIQAVLVEAAPDHSGRCGQTCIGGIRERMATAIAKDSSDYTLRCSGPAIDPGGSDHRKAECARARCVKNHETNVASRSLCFPQFDLCRSRG